MHIPNSSFYVTLFGGNRFFASVIRSTLKGFGGWMKRWTRRKCATKYSDSNAGRREKLLKALLSAAGVAFRKTHDLRVLSQSLA
jgi:hypothetical protein